jgi:hypothetical protein
VSHASGTAEEPTLSPESALAAFRSGEVDPRDHLRLARVEFDNARFAELQRRTLVEDCAEEDAAALDAFLPAELHSAVALDVLTWAWARSGRFDRALDRGLQAVAVTPRWDPEIAARLVNNAAYLLEKNGDLANALVYGQEALRYDPWSPWVLGTVADVAARAGDAERAGSVVAYLRAVGYPDSFLPERQAANGVPVYDPLSVERTRLSDVDVYRLFGANAQDRGRAPQVVAFTTALALSAAGRPVEAYFALHLGEGTDDPVVANHHAQLGRALSDAVPAVRRAEIDAGQTLWSARPATRRSAVAALDSSADVELCWAKAFDPDDETRLAACRTLLAGGLREELLPLSDVARHIGTKAWQRLYRRLAAAPAAGPALRGVALVEAVIAWVQRGVGDIDIALPEPLPEAVLDALTFPDGSPLPPSLRRWLAFDASWLEIDIDRWGGATDPTFETMPVADAVDEYIGHGAHWGQWFPRDVQALPLDYGSETMRLLWLRDPDEHGEYPVVCADVDDTPILYLFHLGFDTWLAHRAGLIEDVEQEYPAQFAEVRERLAFPEYGLDGPDVDLDDDAAPIDEFDDDEWVDEEAEQDEEAEEAEQAEDAEPVAARPVRVLASRTFALPDAPTSIWFAKAIGQAMQGRDVAKPLFLIDEASLRFPDDAGWKSAALIGWSRRHGFELLDRMLATGGDAAAAHGWGTIVHDAARNGDVDVLRRLLDGGASPDTRNHYFNATPLHEAAEYHRVDAVALLLQRGADPAALDRNQSTPLWNALSRFHARANTWRNELATVVRLLLDAGGDPDENAWPIMHRAVECDHGGVVALLLERGTDPERRDHKGDTAIQAAWRARCWESFDALRAAGVRTDTVNGNGWSLDQVASPDGRSPRLVDIDVVDGDHDLDVEVEVLFTNGYMADPDAVLRSVRLLERLATAGVLGLDRYPPGTSIAEWTGQITAVGTAAGQQPLELYRVVGRYHLRAVAPSAIGMWLRALDQHRAVLTGAGVAGARMAALTVRSVEPSRRDRLDLERWRTDPPWDTVRPWTDLPFEVTEATAKQRCCVVTADPRHHRAITTTLVDMRTAELDLPRPLLLGWPQQRGEYLLVPALLISGDPPPGTIGVLRALVLNALAALPAGTVQHVEWSLGVVDVPASRHRTRDFANMPDTDVAP